MKSIIAAFLLVCLVAGVHAQCGSPSAISFAANNGADIQLDGSGDVTIHGDASVTNVVLEKAFQGAFQFADHLVLGPSAAECPGVTSYDAGAGEFFVWSGGASVDLTDTAAASTSSKSVAREHTVAGNAEVVTSTAALTAFIENEKLSLQMCVTDESCNVVDIMAVSKEAGSVRLAMDGDFPVVGFSGAHGIAVINCLDEECASASLSTIAQLSGDFDMFVNHGITLATATRSVAFETTVASATGEACTSAIAGTIHNAEGELFVCSAINSADASFSQVFQWAPVARTLSAYF